MRAELGSRVDRRGVTGRLRGGGRGERSSTRCVRGVRLDGGSGGSSSSSSNSSSTL